MKNEIKESISALINSKKSLMLSSIGQQGIQGFQPETSYAPFYCDFEHQTFYIYLSDLASHSRNLQQHANASVLIIEDESNSEQIFARKRVQYSVVAELVKRESEEHSIITEKMKERFGDIIDLFNGLADFKLFQLHAKQGRYVEGFGRAFNIQQGLMQDLVPAMQDARSKK